MKKNILFMICLMMSNFCFSMEKEEKNKEIVDIIQADDECIICYDSIVDFEDLQNVSKTLCCNQFLCVDCHNVLHNFAKQECPYCRNEKLLVRQVRPQVELGDRAKQHQEEEKLNFAKTQSSKSINQALLDPPLKKSAVVTIKEFVQYSRFQAQQEIMSSRCPHRYLNNLYHVKLQFNQKISRSVSNQTMRYIRRYLKGIINLERNLHNLDKHIITIDSFDNKRVVQKVVDQLNSILNQ